AVTSVRRWAIVRARTDIVRTSYPQDVTTIAVIGGGAWGTALAAHSARLGHTVKLWAREADVVHDVNERRENTAFLQGVSRPDRAASTDMVSVCADADVVILVPPSAFLRSVSAAIAPHLPPKARIAIATKGIENDSLDLMIDVVEQATGRKDLAALSGPS